MTATTNMLELVGRAISLSMEKRPLDCEAMARAAVTALREPTKAMVLASQSETCIGVWHAMIDKVLEGK